MRPFTPTHPDTIHPSIFRLQLSGLTALPCQIITIQNRNKHAEHNLALNRTNTGFPALFPNLPLKKSSKDSMGQRRLILTCNPEKSYTHASDQLL
jgi:hypothetical protein